MPQSQQTRQPQGLSVEPLFIQHKDLPASDRIRSLDISLEASKAIGRENVLGSQNVRGIWRLYCKSREKRLELLTKGMALHGKTIPLYEQNPKVTNVDDPSLTAEKLTIKDLPISVSNDEVKAFLLAKGVKITTDPRYSKDRDEDGKLTSFLNGDRYVYATSPIMPVLSSTAHIADQRCRIFHPSQNNSCKICNDVGHKTKDSTCPAYTPPQDIITVVSYQNPLSNMYMGAGVDHCGTHYKSVEHAYQAAKARHSGMSDLEGKITNAKHAGVAKALSHQVPDAQSWADVRVQTMKELLASKALAEPIFRDALLETDDKIIAHTVRDTLWGTGLSPELTRVTRPTYWGKNLMGHLLMELRDGIKEAMQSSASLYQSPLPDPQSTSAPEEPMLSNMTVDQEEYEPPTPMAAEPHESLARGRPMLRTGDRNASPSPARPQRSRPRSRPAGARSASVSATSTPTPIDAFMKRKPSGTPPNSKDKKQSKVEDSEALKKPG